MAKKISKKFENWGREAFFCDFLRKRTPEASVGQNLRSEKLSFGSVHTYSLDRCGEIIDCGERKIEIGRKMGSGGQYL